MRISKARVRLCRLARARPIRNGSYTYTAVGTVVVCLAGPDGLEGIGFRLDEGVLASARVRG